MGESKQVDVLVVGSGGAGSAAARTAADLGASVLLISKDPIVCTDSKISEGIVTVRGSGAPNDTEQALSDNVRIQGDDLSDVGVAKRFASGSRRAYQWLQEQGLRSHSDAEGHPKAMNIPMGGHTQARSVDHANGGLDYAHACWNAINQNHNIEYLEDAWLLDLFTADDGSQRVGGGLVYHASTGRLISINANAVVIAAGGLSTLYFPNTDTMRGNTGDSYAIAARAGAQLIDMEQVQFIPFAVAQPPSYQGLVVGEPVLAGALGVIRDKHGKVIQRGVMGKTRAQCAAAIARAVANGDGTDNDACYLDLTENAVGKAGAAYIALMNEKIGSILKIVRGAMGVKAAKFEQTWEVKPSAHYLMGGIRASNQGHALNQHGQIMGGLYVAGQALGGLHGSNRLGSTSLAEAIIFGRESGAQAATYSANIENELEHEKDCQKLFSRSQTQLLKFYEKQLSSPPIEQDTNAERFPINITRELQAVCWQGIGPARNADQIQQTLEGITRLGTELKHAKRSSQTVWNQSFIDYIECRSLLFVGECIAKSAQQRPRSIGAHVRLDDSKKASVLCRQTPFSTACTYNAQRGIELGQLTRQKSPYARYIGLMIKQKAKASLLALTAKTPLAIRDALLYRIYANALNDKTPLYNNEAAND